MKSPRSRVEKFGTVLGVAPGNVAVYSSDYDSAEKSDYPDRRAYRSYVDGIFMGYKWQCVELARRWFYVNRQLVFDDVPMAYDIFRLRTIRRISDDRPLPLYSFKNGSRRRPEAGSLLIWDAEGEFGITGHVAVVTEVHDRYIRFVEQNVENTLWPEERTFSRQLQASIAADGGYCIEPCFEGASILGWVIQSADDTFAEPVAEPDTALFSPLIASLEDTGQGDSPWVDTTRPAGKAYVSTYGHVMVSDSVNTCKYVCLSETACAQLKRATNELHHLFMRATDHVLQDDRLLRKFNIPVTIWPDIKASWNQRNSSMITGRFDFSISEMGLKAYEYNADSASCYFEAGQLQSDWAGHFGCRIGRDPGSDILQHLARAWKAQKINGILHIMQDVDVEETYHALFMKSAMEDGGLAVKVLNGVAGIRCSSGQIIDPDGIPIKHVWKTWAWETVFEQIRKETTAPLERNAPGLADILLHPEIQVFEPLWTAIPSNKAILPVMWELFPDHPYLLDSQFELTENLRSSGYVKKPIVGRSGENIAIIDTDELILRKTDGRFGTHKRIYQRFCPLSQVEQMNIQVCTFSVQGSYSGVCVRVDPSLVIKGESDVMPLRIVSDEEYHKISGS
ncbi:MAG: glutathionylspermidine synthase family protein [Desulfocapsaceae bacterium]|jgi:glutathionylspermidine amidase/synthetase|nr:glutathionylspermidine synthase family protein [Desulfocapsaceae bacterium]